MEDIATAVSTETDETWLNLGVGNPAPIPEVIAMWQRFAEEAVASDFSSVSCQYGSPQGAKLLVEALVDYFNDKYAWGVTPQNIVVGTGSQTLCFAAAALFTGPGPQGTKRLALPVVPDYTGYQGLCLNADGLVGTPPKIEVQDDHYFRYLLDVEALEQQPDIGMLLTSSPSNPTGRSLSGEELAAIVRLAEARDVPVLVDHAYGHPFPQIAEAKTHPTWHPNVINCFTASKAGIPGERIGFAIAASPYIDAITSFIANTALHAPQLAQMVLARSIRSGELDELTTSVIRPYYLHKRELAEKLLDEAIPQSVSWRIHSGRGGLFCWVWIDHPWFDDEAFYRIVRRRKVLVVPGRHFFVDPHSLGTHGTRCFRISLTADEATLADGIDRIAEGLEELRRAA